MHCKHCQNDVPPADLFEGDVCLACAIARHLDALVELGVTTPMLVEEGIGLVEVDTDAEPPTSPGRARRRARLVVETFEQRSDRLARLPGDPDWSAEATLARVVRAEANLAQSAVSDHRECPICRRMFKGARIDRITCPDGNHCRDIVRRLRAEDPTAGDAIRMLFAPPDCAGCGEPLWGKRPDAKHHNGTCVKRRQRAQAKEEN